MTCTNRIIKVGDLHPQLEAQITSCATGLPIDDMDQVTAVTFIMYGIVDGVRTEVINEAASIESVSDATVLYTFTGTQTDEPGEYEAYFRLFYGASTHETFPNEDSIPITIEAL